MEHFDRVALALEPGEVGTVVGWRGEGRGGGEEGRGGGEDVSGKGTNTVLFNVRSN